MNNNVPVVQGFAISQQNQNQMSPAPLVVQDYGDNGDNGDNFSGYKGEPQPKKFNDVFFSVLFFAHLIALACVLPASLNAQGDNGGGDGNIGSIVYFVSVCGVFATGLSTVSLGFMMRYANQLVKLALYFQIATSLAMAILMLMAGSIMIYTAGWEYIQNKCW